MLKPFNKLVSNLNFDILKISTILVCIFFGINFSIEYATDTYSTFMEADTWKWMLYENGRLFNAAIYYLFEALHVPNGYTYRLSYLLALICLIIALYILAELLHEFCQNTFLCVAVSFLTLSNLFVIEYFLFIEKGLFMLTLLLCTLAAKFTINYLRYSQKQCLLLSLILLTWAVFIYQIILAIYVILCLPFIIKYSANLKTFIINNIIVAFLYGFPLLLAFIIIKFSLESSRMGGISNIFINFIDLIPTLVTISTQKWFNLPQYILGRIILITCILGLYFIIRNRKHATISNGLFSLIYLLLGTIFTAFFPFISGITNDYIPRTIYPYGCIYGIVLIYILITYPIDIKPYIMSLVTLLVIFILTTQYFNFETVFIERYKVNQIDKYYSEIIGTKIREYEENSGYNINTICFYHDVATTWYDHGCEESQLIPRAQSCGWSNLNAINLYLDKNYTKGEPLPKYEKYFSQYTWDTFSDKQAIFEENVLHLCIY